MYRICVPPELAIPHLLEWEGVNATLRDLLEEVVDCFNTGDDAGAYAHAEHTRVLAEEESNYYAGSLSRLFQAEALRRLHKWEDCLDTIREARRWLDVRIGAVALYNRAIAVYLEGLVHFMLGADLKTLKAFSFVQSTLDDSERHWTYERNYSRAEDCRCLRSWVSDLRKCMPFQQPADHVLVLPVYRITDKVLDRTSVFALDLSQSVANGPMQVLAQPFSAAHEPVDGDALLLARLDPKADYFAIRFPEDRSTTHPGDQDDLLILRVETKAATLTEAVLTQDRVFVRRRDGRIQLRSSLYATPRRVWTSIDGRARGNPVLIIGGTPNE
jgi:hypothetical protein